MKRIVLSTAIALLLTGSGWGHAQPASSSVLNVPTVVVTVTQLLPLSLSSIASYHLYNGGKLVSMSPGGGLVVNGPPEIRFIVQSASGTTYSPVGISFKEAPSDASGGKGDPLGRSAFPMRTFVSQGNTTQLSVFDADPASAEFEFSLMIESSGGTMAVIDPPIINKTPV